jgi:hypothetical protein
VTSVVWARQYPEEKDFINPISLLKLSQVPTFGNVGDGLQKYKIKTALNRPSNLKGRDTSRTKHGWIISDFRDWDLKLGIGFKWFGIGPSKIL